jgi:hypothetical protein
MAEHTESDIRKISTLYCKTLSYVTRDPEVAVMLCRKTAESICKVIFRDKVSDNTKAIMLDKLLDQLGSEGHIPKRVMNHLRTIQVFGNYGVHDQDDDEDAVDSETCEPCMNCLNAVYKWFLKDFAGRSGADCAALLMKAGQTNICHSSTVSPVSQPPHLPVAAVAKNLNVRGNQLIALLMRKNVIVSLDGHIERKTAEIVAQGLGRKLTI